MEIIRLEGGKNHGTCYIGNFFILVVRADAATDFAFNHYAIYRKG